MPKNHTAKAPKDTHGGNGAGPSGQAQSCTPRVHLPGEKKSPRSQSLRSMVKGESRVLSEGSLRAQLKEMMEELEELELSMESSDWDPMSDYHTITDEVRLQINAAQELIDELESVSDQDWDDQYSEAQEAVDKAGGMLERISDIVMEMIPE